MNKKVLIITGAGLLIGFAEAIIYYNIGRNENKDKFKFQFPQGVELLKTSGIIIGTSLATAALSNILENWVNKKVVVTPLTS